MMNFIQHWKPYFVSILLVGLFFLLWDSYFAYQNVWGFNDDYLVGLKILKLPLEEILFFIFIPYSSIFIHYSLKYFFPRMVLGEKTTTYITYILFGIGFLLTIFNTDKIYTFVCLSIFTSLLLLQIIFKWSYARRFYLSFVVIFIPFYFVNGALTGSYSEKPVVFYDNTENLGIRMGTIPVEDAFYCFALLYSIIVLFEYLKKKM